jgi:uncharacterized membrane protein YqiK
MFPLKPGYAAH